MIELIEEATITDGPNPWAASVHVQWDYRKPSGRRNKSRKIRNALNDLKLGTDYSLRYDDVLDKTIIYFRDKTLAVTVYLELS